MNILEYDEVDPLQVLDLNQSVSVWPLTLDWAKRVRRTDKTRIPDYLALFAVEKGEVQSQLGYIYADTETTEGTETLGYIWGVCTYASAARKGYATALIAEAHRRMLDRGVRYAFLGTSKAFVARSLYDKLGYHDFLENNMVIKACGGSQSNKTGVSFAHSKKKDDYVRLLRESTRNMLGFVHRPDNFIEVRKIWSLSSIKFGLFMEGERPIGYMLGNVGKAMFRILELVCPNEDDIPRCIDALEEKFKPRNISMYLVPRKKHLDVLLKSGFRHIPITYGIYMIKDLKGKKAIGQMRKMYDIGGDRFHMTDVDSY